MWQSLRGSATSANTNVCWAAATSELGKSTVPGAQELTGSDSPSRADSIFCTAWKYPRSHGLKLDKRTLPSWIVMTGRSCCAPSPGVTATAMRLLRASFKAAQHGQLGSWQPILTYEPRRVGNLHTWASQWRGQLLCALAPPSERRFAPPAEKCWLGQAMPTRTLPHPTRTLTDSFKDCDEVFL